MKEHAQANRSKAAELEFEQVHERFPSSRRAKLKNEPVQIFQCYGSLFSSKIIIRLHTNWLSAMSENYSIGKCRQVACFQLVPGHLG